MAVISMHCTFHIEFFGVDFPKKSLFLITSFICFLLFVFILISMFYLYSDRTSFKNEYG